METRSPAPPATPIPTYYDPLLTDFGAGTVLDLVPDGSGGLTIDDWNIPTPDGDLTPANSQITSGGDFPAHSFFDVFTDITLDPIILQETNGPRLGSYWDLELGPVGGTITDPDGGSSRGSWNLPDHTPTWLLLIAAMAVLRVGQRRITKGRA